jgi:hypothetical protein
MTTGSALPILPQSVSRGGSFRGFTGSLPLRPARLLAPLHGSDWNSQPSGTFTLRLSTGRSPSPSLSMTTTVTGLLCWRDLHPLEWQLASLHGHQEPPTLATAAAGLAPIADASEAWRRSTGGRVPLGDGCSPSADMQGVHRGAWKRGGVAACGAGAAGGSSTARRRVDERRSEGFFPASSPIIGADDECCGISVREQPSAWIAQDLQPSLSDL